jgi:hypothetical protein
MISAGSVFGLGDLVAGPGPQRLHRVQRLRLGDAHAVLGAALHRHPDRPADEVRVLLHDLADLPLGQVVREPVLAVGGLEVQRDRGAGRQVVVGGADVVGARAVGLPQGALLGAGPAGAQRHLVGDHERRVEADAELPDQALRGRGVLGLLDLLQQGRGPGLGDGADQLHHLVPGHPDAVVADGQRTGVAVDLQGDVQIRGVGPRTGVGQRFQPQLVQRVGGVGDQLSEKDVLVGVDGVDHQVQQLARLGLELQRLDTASHRRGSFQFGVRKRLEY